MKTTCITLQSAAVILLSGMILLSACNLPRHRTFVPSGPITVEVMEVDLTPNVRVGVYVGTVAASKSVLLTSPYSGTLTELKVQAGEVVSPGQTVAVIDSRTVVASRDMAHASLRQAQDGYDRLSQVHRTGSVAQVQMVEIETQLSKARAAAAAADKALEDCTVKAPFAGVIGEVFPAQGVEMQVSGPIATVLDIAGVKISFPVPENEIGRISQGDEALVEVPALQNRSFRARVVSKGVTASRLSHSYECTLEPSAAVDGLLPGMVCKVYMEEDAGRRIVIPASVVMMDAHGRYVWTVQGTTVHKTYITVGEFCGQGILVEDGISPGDRVIVQGATKVSSGMQVKVSSRTE